jgi:argininosuccinate lyase
LADTWVRDEGLSFRQAHEIAAATAKTVIADGEPLGEGFHAFRGAFTKVAKRAARMQEAAFVQAVSAQTFIARRDRPGGPAPSALDAALDTYTETLASLRATELARNARHQAAETTLNKAFAALSET